MESDHGLEKILGVGLELEFKSMESDWIRTPKEVTPLISGVFQVSFIEKIAYSDFLWRTKKFGSCNSFAKNF